jgi:hypothetical protein
MKHPPDPGIQLPSAGSVGQPAIDSADDFPGGCCRRGSVDPVELSYSTAGRKRDMPDFSITPAVVKLEWLCPELLTDVFARLGFETQFVLPFGGSMSE